MGFDAASYDSKSFSIIKLKIIGKAEKSIFLGPLKPWLPKRKNIDPLYLNDYMV